MTLYLGVDTGGTYTDAVLIKNEEAVIASAKSLTTRADLALGIGRAVEAVLDQAAVPPDDISLVSLSTTLATNALVEGQGQRVCLVFIGFSERDIARQGLDQALADDPVISVAGGHSHAGAPVAPLDADALRARIADLDGGVSGFAVASQFATRNPEHEIEARDIIRSATGKPVTCSHELSAKLGGPKRAMTAVLNARLIGMIARLIEAMQGKVQSLGIDAPMMVVRGDGALISADLARERPIETILSGPAASVVGARWLSDADHALVSDIGGTTTDVAVLRDGKPSIDPAGAKVGGFRTMVEAVAMRTTGLGGDSELHLARDGLAGGLSLGPRRLMPVALCARDWPQMVHETLDAALASEKAGEFDGRFAVPTFAEGRARDGLPDREAKLLDRLGDQAMPVGQLLRARIEIAVLERLVSKGLILLSGVTPSDAAHVLGWLEAWDADASAKALTLFGRMRTGAGDRLAEDPLRLAQSIIDQLTQQTAEALLETAFAEDDHDFVQPPADLARHVLTQAGLLHHRGLLRLDCALNLPVIGLGASAPTYYGAVGERLGCPMILPEHAGVANAIGAVVGQVSIRKSGQISSAGEGRFRVHFEDGPCDFSDKQTALSALQTRLEDDARSEAETAGAVGIRVSTETHVSEAMIEGKTTFVSADLTATASGRPRVAT